MKVAYLSWPPLFNADVSLVSELNNYADVHYYIEVSPRYSNGAGISIKEIYRKIGIFKAAEIYPEFKSQGYFRFRQSICYEFIWKVLDIWILV